MIVTMDKAALQRRLRVAERIVPKRSGLPFHHVVNFDVSVDGAVTIWVQSAKEAYATQIEAQGDWEDGVLAVPAQELFRAVATAPGDRVTLRVEEDHIRVEASTARWLIEALVGVEAVPFDSQQFAVGTDGIDQAELVRGLEAVRYAAGKSENNRPSFAQVHVGEGRAVASDGARLHQEALVGAPAALTFDIPEKAVDTLLEALSAEGADGEVTTGAGDDEMTFVFGSMRYVVGRSVYEFPNVEEIILQGARQQTGSVVVSRDALVTAIKVASVSVEDGGAVRLRFTHGVIEVEGHSSRSEGRMEVRAGVDGIPSAFSLKVRADDLLELLGKFPVEGDGDIVFTINTSGTNPGWLYVSGEGTEAAVRPVIA